MKKLIPCFLLINACVTIEPASQAPKDAQREDPCLIDNIISQNDPTLIQDISYAFYRLTNRFLNPDCYRE